MRFKEYLEEQNLPGFPGRATGKDPREKEKVKFFGELIMRFFGLKVTTKKDRNEWVFRFKSKGMELGRTSLRLGTESFGDIIFGESTGIFTTQDSEKAKERVKDAYEKMFGARGKEGEKTFKQLKREVQRARR